MQLYHSIRHTRNSIQIELFTMIISKKKGSTKIKPAIEEG